MTTLKQARAAITAALSDAIGAQTNVYGYEARPGGLNTPTAVTVATAGVSDTEWLLVVRVYVLMRNADFAAAQDKLDDLTVATDNALEATPVPRSAWQVQYVEELDCIVSSSTVTYPRDDF